MTHPDLTALRARLRERIGRKRRGYMLPVDTADLWDVLDALRKAGVR